ncbi:MAG: glycosyltransferase family 9 protein [Candidatus Omnitrophica bacterium]|nr:glycosyltransferase family 9 protein [Candidatus Omnitrophota bacterium]
MAVKGNIKSFLVINTFGIGDVLFSTPLLRNLRDSFPEAKIYYMCNRKTASVLKANPIIEKVFVYERDEFVAAQKESFFVGLKEYRKFISAIKRERIDCSIDLSLNAPFGFFALLAGIKKRYGLDYKNRSKFLNRKVKIEGFIDKPVADYYLDVLSLLGIPVKRCGLEVYTDSQSRLLREEFLKKEGISKADLIIGIAPCGGDAFGKDNYLRRWPPEKFSLLIDRLIEEFKAKIFIFAGPKEKNDVFGILKTLKNKDNVFEFTDSSLEFTVALVECCNLFISNDTGILRFAEALKKKIVALYGPTDEKIYGPYFCNINNAVIIKNDLPCRPCYRKFRLAECKNDRSCMKDIEVIDVMSAVKRMLSKE